MKKSNFRKSFIKKINEEQILKTKINVRMMLNEVCKNYDDLSSDGQIEILKEILLLLTELVFADNPTQITISQGIVEKE